MSTSGKELAGDELEKAMMYREQDVFEFEDGWKKR
jgi:hypothetical protein